MDKEYLCLAGQVLRGLVFILYSVIKRVLYLLMHLLFITTQDLMWRVTGVKRDVTRCKYPKNYGASAQIMKIATWSCFDYVLPVSLADFMLTHEGFVHPEYVLQDNITLFFIDGDTAVFAECDEGVQIWRSDYSAFIKTATLKHARKLILMPLTSLEVLSYKVGPPQGKLNFLHNTARCGSTLVTQIFENTDKCVSFSEPDIFVYIALIYSTKNPPENSRKLLKHVINLMCKPVTSPDDVIAYHFKVSGHSGRVLPYLFDLYPDAGFLFLYRNVKDVARSMHRAMQVMPTALFACYMGFVSTVCSDNSPEIYFDEDQLGFPPGLQRTLLDMHVWMWCKCLLHYAACRRMNKQLKCFRYEHLVKEPELVVRAVFKHCQLPEELVEKGVRAMKQDAHRTSLLSGVGKLTAPSLTPWRREVVNDILEHYELPKIGEDDTLEGMLPFR